MVHWLNLCWLRLPTFLVSLFPLVPSSLQVSTNLSSIFTQAQLGPCYFDREVTCHQLWISLEVTLLLTRLNISDKKGGVLPALFLEKCKWSAKLRSETQEMLSNSPRPESTSPHRIGTFFWITIQWKVGHLNFSIFLVAQFIYFVGKSSLNTSNVQELNRSSSITTLSS